MGDEEDLNQLTIQAQILQRQGQTLQNQLEIFQQTLSDVSMTIETLENLPKAKEEGRVPIGSGVYLTCQKILSDEVLITVGAGLIVQKKVPEAVTLIKDRQKSIADAYDKAQKSMMNINKQLQEINAKASVVAARLESDVRPSEV